MKKIAMALIAAVSMNVATHAQNKEMQQGEKKFNKTEMIQKRTDKMVEKYGLNDQQAKQLLTLNTEYADKMGPMGGRPGFRHDPKSQGTEIASPKQVPQQVKEKPQHPDKEQMEARMKEMKANREAYENKLKNIMTAEQYAKYTEDAKQMRQRNPHNGKGGFHGDRRQQEKKQD